MEVANVRAFESNIFVGDERMLSKLVDLSQACKVVSGDTSGLKERTLIPYFVPGTDLWDEDNVNKELIDYAPQIDLVGSLSPAKVSSRSIIRSECYA